jgi:hypothetical protein
VSPWYTATHCDRDVVRAARGIIGCLEKGVEVPQALAERCLALRAQPHAPVANRRGTARTRPVAPFLVEGARQATSRV